MRQVSAAMVRSTAMSCVMTATPSLRSALTEIPRALFVVRRVNWCPVKSQFAVMALSTVMKLAMMGTRSPRRARMVT